jgi:hypothetical protein
LYVIIHGDTSLLANFTPRVPGEDDFRVSVNSEPLFGGGSVLGGGIYSENETALLLAIPNGCYTFIN